MATGHIALPGRASDAGPDEYPPLDFTELLIEIESEAEYARKTTGTTALIRNRQRNSLYEIIRKAERALEMLP